jgi:hypothetical protein
MFIVQNDMYNRHITPKDYNIIKFRSSKLDGVSLIHVQKICKGPDILVLTHSHTNFLAY